MTAKFEEGKTYATRSAVDADTVHGFQIIRRTEKSVWIVIGFDEVRRAIRTTDDGVEMFDPYGRYSMSPVIYADKPQAEVERRGPGSPPAEEFHCECAEPYDVADAKCGCGGWLQGPADLDDDEDEPTAQAPALAKFERMVTGAHSHRLQPYQVQTIKHVREFIDEKTLTPVDMLKQSSNEVARVARFAQATISISRFAEKLGKPVSRENVQFFLDMISIMTAEDFDDVDLIREFLRGE